MSIAFVPIPYTELAGCEQHWFPFIDKIAERNGDLVSHLINPMINGEIGIGIAWDTDAKKALALLGYRIKLRSQDRVAEIIWLTGAEKGLWEGLNDDVELFFREHCKCRFVTSTARPGWKPFMKSKGYRMTHIVMEKEFV